MAVWHTDRRLQYSGLPHICQIGGSLCQLEMQILIAKSSLMGFPRAQSYALFNFSSILMISIGVVVFLTSHLC